MMKKRYNKRRTYRKKRNYKRSRKSTLGNVASLAKTAFKTAKFVAGLVNVEYKYYDIGAGLVTSTWNGAIVNLCQPAQGITALTRTGDSIKIKNLTFRGEFNKNVLGIASEVVRMIIFWDKQNVINTVADFLQYTGLYGSVYSQKNENTKYETKTLYDRSYIINSTYQQRKFDVVLKINQHCNFQAGSTTIDTGALKVLYIGQSPINGPQFSYNSRCTYIDN